MKNKICCLLLGVLSSWSWLSAQEVVINEIMASNNQAVADEDGDYPDWIELYNKGSAPCDLTGYGLSDSKKTISSGHSRH